MKTTLFAAFLLGMSQVYAFPIASTENYPYTETLVNGSYILYWKHNETHITFETHVKTLGWIGFGISDNGNMYPSDIVMGWVKDGIPFFEDRQATQYGVPIKDKVQNWHLIQGSESGETTVLKFERALDTCDTVQDKLITKDLVHVIYAWDDADPDPTPQKHTVKGTSLMYLLDPITPDVTLPLDAESFMFSSIQAAVKPQLTYYHCTAYQFPALDRKHHAIAFEPYIQPGNEDIVHHAVLMVCSEPFSDSDNGTSYDCTGKASKFPQQFQACYSIYQAWAIGGKTFYLPENVGQTIGDASGPRYYVFQVHYNNPKLEAGRIDSSGIRAIYTPTLRKFDAGMLEMGVQVSPAHVIPPHYIEFVSRGYCTSDCFSQAITETNPMYIFAVFLHSHLLGRKLRLRHIRDGEELKPISVDNNYDFDFQQTRQLRVPVVVKPTDTLIMECVYASHDKENATFGGLGTDKEMCLAFISYYPDTSGMANCLSTPTYNAEHDFVSIRRESRDLLGKYDWTNWNDRLQFQCLVDRTDQYLLCDASGSWYQWYKPVPKIEKRYVEDSTCPGHTQDVTPSYDDYICPIASASAVQATVFLIGTSLLCIYL